MDLDLILVACVKLARTIRATMVTSLSGSARMKHALTIWIGSDGQVGTSYALIAMERSGGGSGAVGVAPAAAGGSPPSVGRSSPALARRFHEAAEWYQKIGIAVSVSDFESFHFTLADGAASGAVPVSLAWPGAELIYPSSWLSFSIGEMSDRVLHTSRSEETFSTEGRKSQRFAQEEYCIQRTLESVVDVITMIERP